MRLWTFFLHALCCVHVAACASQMTVAGAARAVAPYSGAASEANAAPAEVARFLLECAEARGHALHGDARLARVAARLAAEPANMTRTDLELALRRQGIYDARYAVLTSAVRTDLATSSLCGQLEETLRGPGYTHYGAVWSVRGGVRVITVVLSARRVWLSPMPNSVPLHAMLHLRGHLLSSFRNLRVEVITDASRSLIPLAPGHELSVQLPARQPGLQRIELRGESDKGVETLAKLPVYVGQPFPERPVASDASAAHDLAAVALRIFTSINRERDKAGLPALERDARLDALAHAHSLDMRAHDFVDNTSARTGDAIQRVAQAGLPTPLVLESVARARTPSALEAGPATPTHDMGNMLSRQATHVGIGVVSQRDAFGTLLIATELYVELPERIDIASASPRLLGLLNEARAGRGAPTVSLDVGLSSVALRAAEQFVQDPNATERAILAQADKELSRFSLSYRRVNALLALTPRLQDAASLEPALDPDADGIGIGIAQGERGGASVLAIVMILGSRR